jgi:cholesterol transport system auxiliary component
MSRSRTLPLAAALAAAAMLAGCISLLPKAQPVQLYRFGETAPAPSQAAAQARFTIAPALTGFDRAAAGDRILTVNGGEAAYIKGSRWVSSALSQFDNAVQRAFDADNGPARLASRGEMGRGDYLLKLDVRRFQAEYRNGAGAPPTIVVDVHASLGRTSDRLNAGAHVFHAEVTAGDNRVGPIADAFDKAVAQVVGEIVAWADNKGVG